MSYILDALKKAERQRRRESNSELMLSGNSLPAQKKRPFWPYFLIAVLLLNAGILFTLFGPWSNKIPLGTFSKDPGKSAPVEIVRERFDLEKPMVPLKADPTKPAAVRKAGQLETVLPASPKTAPGLSQADLKAGTKKTSKSAEREETKHKPGGLESVQDNAQIASESRKTPMVPAGKRIYKLNELPQSVREGLPDLSLSLHLYNVDPASRLINVTGKTLKEGEELSSGLRVEQITPEGAVFNFHDYRFQVGLNSGN